MPNAKQNTKQRFTMVAIVLLILRRNNQVLLMRRQNTGWLDGDYDLVAGHVDGNETLPAALCREALEEIGVTIKEDAPVFSHLLHYIATPNPEYLYNFFTVDQWKGEPTILETTKCDDLRWFDLDDLPDNLAPVTKLVLDRIKSKEIFTEFKPGE